MYLQWTLFGSVYAVGGILLTVSEVAACCIVWSHGVRQLCQMNKSNQRAMESGNLYSRIRRK